MNEESAGARRIAASRGSANAAASAGRKRPAASRGQAALFDGIMFLLFASFSVSMIFVFVGDYGKAQDATLRTGYMLAYMQQVGKVIFFTHVKTLADVATKDPALSDAVQEVCWKDPEWNGTTVPRSNCLANPRPLAGYPYSDLTGPQGCASLSTFELSTVSDLLKKDLGDGSDEAYSCFDDHFGTADGVSTTTTAFCTTHSADWSSVPRVPGKTALRCVMKELMKPLQTAGYKYFVDFEKQHAFGSTIPMESVDVNALDSEAFRITNHWAANANNWGSCDNATSKDTANGGGAIQNILTVSLPFRVNSGNTLTNSMDFIMRVCIWPTTSR